MTDSHKRMHPRLLARAIVSLLPLLISVVLVRLAAAQPLGKVAVAIVDSGGARSELDLAMKVEEQLARRHVLLISMHEARDRFTVVSRSPQEPSSTDLEALAKEARTAVEHVAFGRSAAAEQSVRGIVALAERSLESLNRETRNARQLLDACLALVRSSLHEGRREQAIERAMGCRRLVPDLVPSSATQPANVIGVLAEADDELRRMRIGSLRVDSAPQRNCSVYLNGRHLGMTPFALDRAAVGAYRVQVECEEKFPGRVHIVHLGDRPVELRVDSEFDRAVVAEPRLGLRYTRDNVRNVLSSHGVRLGREIRADDVILVGSGAAALELIRVNVTREQVVAAVRVSGDASGTISGAALSSALDALGQGRFVGIAADYYYIGEHATPDLRISANSVAPAHPDAPTPSKTTTPVYKKWWLWTTVGLVVAGGVAAGVVLGLQGRNDASADEPVISF